jgi:uncharacterized membrane protein YeaQ/YmgE (transglycosylase-associated protein family)
MGILSWLGIGLVAAYVGSKLVNRTGEGLVRDLLLGVTGAIVGAIFHSLGYVATRGLIPATTDPAVRPYARCCASAPGH